MQLLNSKWRLYGRAVFREELLAEFLTVLIRVLVAKSHNLLREDIGAAVFGLASVDLAAFHSAFLPSLLAGLEGLDDSQRQGLALGFKPEPDMPTFLTNLDRSLSPLGHSS